MSGATRYTKDPKELLIARNAANVIDAAGYLYDGFSMQMGSGGASLAAAFQVAARPENAGKNIVTIIPDSGMKYLSMHVFSEDPML